MHLINEEKKKKKKKKKETMKRPRGSAKKGDGKNIWGRDRIRGETGKLKAYEKKKKEGGHPSEGDTIVFFRRVSSP